MKPVTITPTAAEDLHGITGHYLTEAGVAVTAQFLARWDRCTAHIARFPESGSLRFAELLGLSGLRVWPVRGFPYLALYVEEGPDVVVLRVLHAARDIPGETLL